MKFISDNIILIGLAFSSGMALLWMTLQNLGPRASAVQATQLINRGKTLILDVRAADEFGTGHLQNAKNIPLAELGTRLGELDKFKAQPVIVVCNSGTLSGKATSQLVKAGFAQAVTLEGGIAAWKEVGLPIAK